MKKHNVPRTKTNGLFRQSIKHSRKVAALLLVQAMLTPSLMAAELSEQILSINHKNVPISVVLNDIEANTGYSFLVRNNDVNINEKITISATNKNLEEILGQLFDKKGIRYTVENNRITIYKSKTGSTLPSVAQTKTRTITGIVTDQAGEPIIGANITVKDEKNIGTSTDIDGRFSLNVPENSKIEVSYVGYLTQTFPIKNQSSFKIKLTEDTKALEEVVIVGYATQKKGLLTGSVETVKMDDKLRTIPSTSVGELLTGKLAGVNVGAVDSKPGSNPSISIRTGSSWRSNSQPVMYVIDGVVRGSGDFNNLSPNEIEDVTVLKDAAAAAVYGSRSAGGVIVVTTKKGSISKPTINYSYSYTIDKRTKNMDLTDGVQTYELYNRMNPDPNTNWAQDELDELAKINGGWG
ncbi:MAG: carboxypeptidase-like regulatory domain-containing protein, partial [Tannerellaceae bacterium]